MNKLERDVRGNVSGNRVALLLLLLGLASQAWPAPDFALEPSGEHVAAVLDGEDSRVHLVLYHVPSDRVRPVLSLTPGFGLQQLWLPSRQLLVAVTDSTDGVLMQLYLVATDPSELLSSRDTLRGHRVENYERERDQHPWLAALPEPGLLRAPAQDRVAGSLVQLGIVPGEGASALVLLKNDGESRLLKLPLRGGRTRLLYASTDPITSFLATGEGVLLQRGAGPGARVGRLVEGEMHWLDIEGAELVGFDASTRRMLITTRKDKTWALQRRALDGSTWATLHHSRSQPPRAIHQPDPQRPVLVPYAEGALFLDPLLRSVQSSMDLVAAGAVNRITELDTGARRFLIRSRSPHELTWYLLDWQDRRLKILHESVHGEGP